jgi:MoaA/NifB/PqqE/SkfB family radical SAM enzyme
VGVGCHPHRKGELRWLGVGVGRLRLEGRFVSVKEPVVTPRYATIFLNRACPRACSYCMARLVKVQRRLKPEEWLKAFDILRVEGVKFFLILGNEVLAYAWIVDLVRMLKENGFWGMYAMYSTFPEPLYSKLREKLVEAGLYNMSAGVDIIPGLTTGDKHIDTKSIWGLEQLVWFKEHGVPDVHATVTIHEHNYRLLDRIMGVISSKGIWVGANLIHYSLDGLHDFFGTVEDVRHFLIKDRKAFKEKMYQIANEVRAGKYRSWSPPEYYELIGDLGGQPLWHCNLPLLISIDADGSLRLCGYRPFYKHRGYTVFDIGTKITMEDYARWYMVEANMCPNCAWNCHYTAELYFLSGDPEYADRLFQVHASKYFRG